MRKRVQFRQTQPSMTQQHLKKECDVNSILEKYRKTGQITHVRQSQGMYGDFSQYTDFKSNLDMVKSAFNQFDELPAHVRKRFQNDPSELIDFVMDPKNREEATKLGLITASEKKSVQNDDQTTKKPDSPKTEAKVTPKPENAS